MHPLVKPSARRASYPFQLRDPLSGRWLRARFLARLADIPGCCAAWEIVGAAASVRLAPRDMPTRLVPHRGSGAVAAQA